MPDASVGVSKNMEWEEKLEWKLNYLDEWGVEKIMETLKKNMKKASKIEIV